MRTPRIRLHKLAFAGQAPNKDEDYPKPLEPIDDLPPVTVITHVSRENGKLHLRGTTSDNGIIKRVVVNGQEARASAANFAEWEVTLESTAAAGQLVAHAEDAAGNIEKTPHTVTVMREE